MEERGWYDKNYKLLLLVSLALLIFSIAVIAIKYIKTRDIMEKDVSLAGGSSITVYSEKSIGDVEKSLKKDFPDLSIRSIADIRTGKQLAFVVETKANVDELKKSLQEFLGFELNEKNSSIEFTGSVLGASFYKELLRAIIISFLFMSVVVIIIFRKFIPCIAIIQAAVTDITFAIAMSSLIGMKMSTAGIAAILMLVGYSVDTDIMLTTRVLRRKEGLLNERIWNATKTGLMMTLTSIGSVIVGYFIVFSPVIKQLFLVLFFGLFSDLISTWLGNAGILKWYVERKFKTSEKIETGKK